MRIAPVLLVASSFVRSSALEVRNGPEVCMPMTAVTASLEHLDNEVESARLKLLTSLEKVLTEGEIESSSVEELRRVIHDFQLEIEKCEHQRVEARLDVHTYRRELQEMWEIAHVGIQNNDWTALSLLGERSVTAVHKAAKTQRRQVRVSAGVKRAAEMHWGLVKHAQAVSMCQKKNGNVVNSGNFTEYVNISEDSDGPCADRYQRLRLVYREAYLHISTLLQSSESIAESDACYRATSSLHEERQTLLQFKIQTARREMCQGHRAGLEAEARARKVRERLWATRRLVEPACFSMDWNEYVANVESLVQLTFSRPQCPYCCGMVNMSAELPVEAALLDQAIRPEFTADHDPGSDKGEVPAVPTDRHAQELEERISTLRTRWHRLEESAHDSSSTSAVER